MFAQGEMEKILEYFGVITGLLYLLLEIKQHRAMWVVGFLTSLTYVFVFFFAKVYADMGLNVYYTSISIYGFLQWSRKGRHLPVEKHKQDKTIVYRHVSLRLLMGILLFILVIWGGLWYLLSRFTDSPIPVGDAFTTAVGIVATWMLAHYIIEHWIFWVIVNCVSVYLYFFRELYPTMFLYICYALLAIAGWYTWKKKGVNTNADDKPL